MGIWKMIKTLYAFRNEIKAEKLKNDAYLKMNTDSLSALPDGELYNAVKIRLKKRISYENMQASFDAMTFAQKIFFALDYFEMEVNNGGLCQFFVNSSRMVAPYISEYLSVIEEIRHKDLFDDFVQTHHIDLTDLRSFMINGVEEYEAQTQRYPFDAFDDAFFALPSLESSMVKFVREHIEDF